MSPLPKQPRPRPDRCALSEILFRYPDRHAARELCRIAKKGPMHLRLVAIITRTAGELAVLVHMHLGLTNELAGAAE